MPTEFQLIQKFFAKQKKQRKDVLLGIGDDCALVKVSPDQTLAVSTDTLVSGVHFPKNTLAQDIGYKALAVNLSDLAAMGAKPVWVMLALTLPKPDEKWLKDFCIGFFKLIDKYHLQLIGGDTTRGDLSITVQVFGLVPSNKALRRSQAKPGDGIYVTGALGDAALALKYLQKKIPLQKKLGTRVLERLNHPIPCIETGLALRNIAHSAIDISDGLVADLSHILAASRVGARVCVEDVLISPVLATLDREMALTLALNGGDDYELCFTVPLKKEKLLKKLKGHVTRIGEIEAKPGLRLHYRDGKRYTGKIAGYRHF